MELLKSVMDALREVLTRRRDAIWLAVKQRAKFEGWLKLELARALKEAGLTNIRLECQYVGKKKADLAFGFEDGLCFIELSMCNTNWRVEGVESATRPITKNVEHVLKDIEKLKMVKEPNLGIALTLFFPVPIDWSAQDLLDKVSRIKGGKELLKEPYILDTVEVGDGVGVAAFLFGPYRSGRALFELLGLRSMLKGIRVDEDEIAEAKKSLWRR